MNRTPLIAVVARRLSRADTPALPTVHQSVPQPYLDAVRRAGARPLVVTLPDPAPAEEILEPFDGLLLTGGPDVDPRWYATDRHPTVYGVDDERDDIELRLTRTALQGGLPLLGICRGMQIMVVALGGTLIQNLSDVSLRDDAGGEVVAHGAPAAGLFSEHDVRLRPGSRLARLLEQPPGGVLGGCVAAHHQAVDRLPAGLHAVAWAKDGCIEAVETEGRSFAIGVQWHPEMNAAQDPLEQRLFDGLVAAARADAPMSAVVA